MSVAYSYGKALYEAALDAKSSQDAFDEIENNLGRFLEALNQSKDLKTALYAPITSAKEKISLVEETARKGALPKLLEQFLILLARKGRLTLLPEIIEAFRVVRLNLEGGVPGKLVAAEKLKDSDVQILAKAFSQKLGKKVSFRVTTDLNLLAGMKVTVNGVTYDGSLRSQLQRLRDQLILGKSQNQF